MFDRRRFPGEPRRRRLEIHSGVRQAMDHARAEAMRLGHNFVGTEHLLLGAARVAEGAMVFFVLRISMERLYEETAKLLGISIPPPVGGATPPPIPPLTLTDRAQRCLELAMAEARESGSGVVRVLHLLIAISRENGVGGVVLHNCGITTEILRGPISRTTEVEPAPPATPAHGLTIDEQSDRSIYEQLVSQVKEGVATGRLRPGQRLPSVRALADELDIAPGTVARAYAELERLGVVVTEGARGTRIAEPAKAARSDAGRPENLAGLLRPVVVAAFHLGATAADLRDALERAMSGILDGDDDDGAGSGALVPA